MSGILASMPSMAIPRKNALTPTSRPADCSTVATCSRVSSIQRAMPAVGSSPLRRILNVSCRFIEDCPLSEHNRVSFDALISALQRSLMVGLIPAEYVDLGTLEPKRCHLE